MIKSSYNTFNTSIDNYFLILFSILPLTIVIGSAASTLNIILIDLFFIALILKKKNYFFFKSKIVIYLFYFYLYLIFNSFISIDFREGFLRNFGFIRFIILFIAFNYFFIDKIFFRKVLSFWLIFISIVLIDVYVESFSGNNILGYSGEKYNYSVRIVSFFKDEPIVGSYLSGFFLLLIGYLFNESFDKKFSLIILFLFLVIIAIFLTGERSSAIRSFLGLGFFLFFFKMKKFKYKFILFSILFASILIIITNSTFLKNRYSHVQHTYLNKDSIYLKLYSSGFQVFQNNKIFGVGNKNYRVETCKEKNKIEETNASKYLCNTHPHQVYIELLSEHGIVGSIIILFILYKLIFSKARETIRSNNYLKLGSLSYIIFIFTPLIPSGAFFGNFLITIFMINLSIFYATDKNLNIFEKTNNQLN